MILPGGDPNDSNHAGLLDLYQAMATLGQDLRTIVMLRYFIGLDATEIGAALALPSATVRTRLRRALALLRAQLQSPRDQQSSTRKGSV